MRVIWPEPAASEFIALLRRECRFRPQAGGSIVEGDETWLERVLVNLVGDAAKYSTPGSPVAVLLEDGHEEIRVRIFDEADGLKDDEIERLFEPF